MILGTGAKKSNSNYCTLVAIVLLLLCLFVSSWADCQTGNWSFDNGVVFGCNSDCSDVVKSCSEVFYDAYTYRYNYYSGMNSAYMRSCNFYSPSGCGGAGTYYGTSACSYTTRCTTQAEADSLNCFINGNIWNGTRCIEMDTTYHCQNSGGSVSGGFGGPNKALIFQCIDDVCTLKQELAGTCQDWGYCPEGVNDCDITDTTDSKIPCSLSGNGTSTNGKCYYSCGNGKNYTCSSKYSTWGGDGTGDVYIGRCDSYPSQTCAPDLYIADSTEQDNPYTDGPVPNDTISGPPIGSDISSDNHDYTRLLEAIHDTLTKSLSQHRAQTWYQYSIDSVLKNNIYYDLEKLNNFQLELNSRDAEKFTLMQETGEDIREARLLLDSIKNFDTLNVTTSTDTAYTNRMDSMITRMDSIRAWQDTSSSLFTKLRNWYTSMFGDSTAIAKRDACEIVAQNCKSSTSSGSEFYKCLETNHCLQVEGGSPWDAGMNMINRGFNSLIDLFFDDDSSSVPVDTSIGDTSLPSSVQSLIDSLRLFNPTDINLDSIQNIVDSLKNDTSSIEINVDSLVTDTSVIKDKFSDYYMPAGTSGGCYTLRANLGNFGGLVDEDLRLEVDFSDFGGFNFCDIGRAMIRIMTLVVCISLTLGSFAAAFGWNKSTGEDNT